MLALSIEKNSFFNKGHLKILILFFLLPAYFILALSCNSHQKEKPFRIGFSQCQSGDEWRKNMLKEINRELSFHDNVELIYKDAEESSQKQIQQIEDLVSQKIDLLIVSPYQAMQLTPVIEKVFEAGIPVVLIDRSINSEKYTAFIGASNFEVGQNAGRYAVSLLKGKGNVVEVMGLPDASPFINRHKGFMDILSKNEGIHYIKTLNDRDKDYIKNVDSTISTTKNIDLFFAQSDNIAIEVYKAVRKYHLENKIKIIGVDGLAVKGMGMDLVDDKLISATVLYPTGGQEAIQTAIKILEHQPYSKENILATTIIDSTNVRIMKLQNQKVIAQQDDIFKRQKRIEEQIAITKNQTNIILAISITLAMALILGAILFYYLQENKKINKKLELQKVEISNQRNQLIELIEKVKEATDAKFNFFTNISHELRTPLTLILGPLEDTLSSSKLHFTNKNNLDFVHKNAMRLLRLINQLMDFRKIEEGKMKVQVTENNISNFVKEIAHNFNELAHKKLISFNIISRANDVMLWFDVNMMDKVLFNLLSNAFKFTPDHGSINVLVEKSGDGNEVLIKVEDSGVGMTIDDIEHAFDVFYQGHNRNIKGTGLGLSLSKELIALHHGTINVKSDKTKGTCFEIHLAIGKSHFQANEIVEESPVETQTYEDAKIYTTDFEAIPEREEEKIISGNQPSILLIEDDDHLRTFLKWRLGRQYEIHVAENGDEGIDTAFDIVPDLIISDIVLPGSNGLQITEKLKQDIRTSHIPIILLTAKGSIEEQIEGIKSQADAFIVKPFHLQHLDVTIKNLLMNREVLREHFTSELPTETRSNSSNKIDRKFVNEFTAIIENNLSNEGFSVDDICKQIGISRVQLYRKVKALIGYNVNDYLLTIRLQKAKFLLVNEDLTISEVSYKVGFGSQAYFSTVFKSKFGITPTEFKNTKSTKTKG